MKLGNQEKLIQLNECPSAFVLALSLHAHFWTSLSLVLTLLHHCFTSKASRRAGFQVTLPCSKLAPGASPREAGIQVVSRTVTEARGKKSLRRAGVGRENNHEIRQASYLSSTVYKQTAGRRPANPPAEKALRHHIWLKCGRDRVSQNSRGLAAGPLKAVLG